MSKPIGHCLCGAVRFSFDESRVSAPDICHCESCRRQSGAPLTATLAVPDTAWLWVREMPKTYRSSPGVLRSFCGTCGTPMAYATEDLPGETHLFIATLVDPEMIVPLEQSFADEALPWVSEMLSLPRR